MKQKFIDYAPHIRIIALKSSLIPGKPIADMRVIVITKCAAPKRYSRFCIFRARAGACWF